jgi:hypothetical protein
MYSWGGSTSDWAKPGGYKYDGARRPYLDKLAAEADAKGGRRYINSSGPDMKLVDPFGKEISSDSQNVVVVGIDVTGSMASWPKEIFDRAPLIYQTLSQYRPDMEICFAAIGDATIDNYPLQINNFAKGTALDDHINALYGEGGGGGQISESYELFAYFMLNKCKLKNATSPFILIYGDEKFYDKVKPAQVKKYIGNNIEAEVDSADVWRGVLQKFNTFFLQKPYGSRGDSGTTAEVKAYWADTIGRQRIIALPSEERAVDVGIGIIAKYWGEYGDYKASMLARHDAKEIMPVEKSIRFLPNDPDGPKTRVSRLLADGKGALSERLDT